MTRKQREWVKFRLRHHVGKHQYREDEARDIAKAMTAKARKKGTRETFNAYPCQFCPYWHVGHERTPYRIFMMTQTRQEMRA